MVHMDSVSPKKERTPGVPMDFEIPDRNSHHSHNTHSQVEESITRENPIDNGYLL
jgi:hypothetical protein